jgi:diketogulonate reductase-like aldo/keto reductase
MNLDLLLSFIKQAVMQYATLSNGVKIPVIGCGCAFGDWTGRSTFQGFLPEQAYRSTELAIRHGIRHFDGAHAYSTERAVGSVLGRHLSDGTISRDDVFLTTKLCHPAAPPHVAISHLRTWNFRDVKSIEERVRDDFAKSLDDLGVGYVDLCLMHWPGAFNEKDSNFARQSRSAVWRTFEHFLKLGTARAIGVCNFTAEHLTQLMEDGVDVAPMVNQVELHPYCQDLKLEAFCKSKGIVLEAYAPFASGAFGLLQDPVVSDIAVRHNKNCGQVILRWHLQLGHVVLPKSTSAERIASNLEIFDFELSQDEMLAITSLQPEAVAPRRTCPDPASIL